MKEVYLFVNFGLKKFSKPLLDEQKKILTNHKGLHRAYRAMNTNTTSLLSLVGGTLLMSSQAHSANLIVNGSFEDDMADQLVPTAWTVNTGDRLKDEAGTLDMVGVQDGLLAFQLQDQAGAPRTSGLTSAAFTVGISTDYTLSAFYANRGNFAGADAFTLDLVDLDGAIITPTTVTDPALAGGVYVEFIRTYAALVPGDYQVVLAATKENSQLLQGTVDNISFEAVPEPSSVTLVGLGAMALLVHRRK